MTPPSDEAVFSGPDSRFRLRVLGYQFPANTSGDDDSNWLMIAGVVTLDGKEWRFVDPCLDTHELLRLADWIDDLATGRSVDDYCGFTEPNLEFERTAATTLRISFSAESAPPWAAKDDAEQASFDMPINGDLGTVSLALKQQLAKFPLRWPAG